MKSFQWKNKQSLAEQLKFFGAKKQGFISAYAKKPRILCKAKVERSWLGGSGNAVLGQSFAVSQAQSVMLQQMNTARNQQQGNLMAFGMARASNASAQSQLTMAQNGCGISGLVGASGLIGVLGT